MAGSGNNLPRGEILLDNLAMPGRQRHSVHKNLVSSRIVLWHTSADSTNMELERGSVKRCQRNQQPENLVQKVVSLFPVSLRYPILGSNKQISIRHIPSSNMQFLNLMREHLQRVNKSPNKDLPPRVNYHWFGCVSAIRKCSLPPSELDCFSPHVTAW